MNDGFEYRLSPEPTLPILTYTYTSDDSLIILFGVSTELNFGIRFLRFLSYLNIVSVSLSGLNSLKGLFLSGWVLSSTPVPVPVPVNLVLSVFSPFVSSCVPRVWTYQVSRCDERRSGERFDCVPQRELSRTKERIGSKI